MANTGSGDVSSQPASGSSSKRNVDWTTHSEPNKEEDAEGEDDVHHSESDSEDWEPPDFISEQCLFCDGLHGSLDNSITHMEAEHGFSIPRRHYLAVEPETLIWYLNLMIRGYRECVSCARGHATVDAAQQHMRAKNHCRVEITPELADFYDLPDENEQEEGEGGAESESSALTGSVQVDETSLRLPSGKILSHRSQPGGPRDPRTASSSANKQAPKPSSSSRLSHAPKSASKELMTTEDFENAAVAPHLARFSPADQQWLSKLPNNEVRALVLSTWRGVDESRREGKRELNRFGGSRGRTLMKHFKPSTPTRKSKWG